MQVILMERVEKLGLMGDVVNVKPGFARNFLLPRGKAMRATEENRKVFETKRAQFEADNLKQREEAQKVAAKMTDVSVVMVRQAGESGQLYGSVSARDIADGVTAAGFTVSRQQILLDKPIKTIGVETVRVALHPEVSVTVTVNVARSPDEAEIQAKTGAAVVFTDEEPEEEEAEADAEMFDEGEALAEGEYDEETTA